MLPCGRFRTLPSARSDNTSPEPAGNAVYGFRKIAGLRHTTPASRTGSPINTWTDLPPEVGPAFMRVRLPFDVPPNPGPFSTREIASR